MKPIMPQLKQTSEKPIYLQLYEYISKAVISGEIKAGEKLPSLRKLAKDLGISVTTASQAYSQLLVEGYIHSKPQSGFYVSDLSYAAGSLHAESTGGQGRGQSENAESIMRSAPRPHLCDPGCFDFAKWKSCADRVLSEFSPLLTWESDPRGEDALRNEIAGYVYQSRGVSCTKEQIIIAAGTQQATLHISRILHKLGIGHVAVEEPGYLPVKNILRDNGFVLSPVSVGAEGIDISRLPANIRSAVYVCPSNQFPTGAVMPVGRRFELLDWAVRNDSIIIEDDYDSELRYFGRPIPALQGLDQNHRVIYLGSFSSTLFPAAKISYMVLPPQLAESFGNLTEGYTQTCSKMEQLTLALFMSQGYYQTGIRRLRSLYGQKLQATENALAAYGEDIVEIESAKSGLNMILRTSLGKSGEELCAEAKKLQIEAVPVSKYADTDGIEDAAGLTEAGAAQSPANLEATAAQSPANHKLAGDAVVLYYHQLPLDAIDGLIKNLMEAWRSLA